MFLPLVSIVVPVFRDSQQLEALLTSVGPSADVEVIVATAAHGDDGGLAGLSRRYPEVHWIDVPRGRGRQMNQGARIATGRWLLFLHVDTRLSDAWIDEVRGADQAGAVGGSFAFRLDSLRRAARVIEWGVALRVRWLGLAYGDQALFVRRDVFERLGGFRPLPLMEDVDFIRRLKRAGPLWHSRVPARSSARRWEQDGWVRRSVENICLVLWFMAGGSPDRLARVYYRRDAGRSVENALGAPAQQSQAPGEREAEGRVRGYSRSPGGPRVTVIIPALTEEMGIDRVLAELPALASSVVVVDNGSADATAARARAAGARVVTEPMRGYGRACLAGLRESHDADIVVFLDADLSDYPADMAKLVDPILKGDADFVLGARGGATRALHARLSRRVCVWLINRLWKTSYTDLGPVRAIGRYALDRLGVSDRTWGWTVEMQITAAEAGLRVLEVPIRQRARMGRSQISGTGGGSVRAGSQMLATIVKLWWTRHARTTQSRVVSKH